MFETKLCTKHIKELICIQKHILYYRLYFILILPMISLTRNYLYIEAPGCTQLRLRATEIVSNQEPHHATEQVCATRIVWRNRASVAQPRLCGATEQLWRNQDCAAQPQVAITLVLILYKTYNYMCKKRYKSTKICFFL